MCRLSCKQLKINNTTQKIFGEMIFETYFVLLMFVELYLACLNDVLFLVKYYVPVGFKKCSTKCCNVSFQRSSLSN